MRAIRRVSAVTAGRQRGWIAAIEPWRGLGYSAAGIGRFLRRQARDGCVFVAVEESHVQGLIAWQEDFLLGCFITLLAVRPESAGRGLGRALVARAEKSTFARRRWLFVSADSTNRAALAFYRKMGFSPVGRLPDLIQTGHTEILLRKARGEPRNAPAASRTGPKNPLL